MNKSYTLYIPKPITAENYTVSWHTSVTDFSETEWEELLTEQPSPFFEWHWLENLEQSQAIGSYSGWYPFYAALTQTEGGLCAVMPLFVKLHSYGEFVYDYQIAEAAYRLGHNYYPKLTGMSPFTPGSLYRLLTKPGKRTPEVENGLFEAAVDFARHNAIFGLHFLHTHPAETPFFSEVNLIGWKHESYIWENKGYRHFEDFLSVLTAKQRKNIRSERKKIAALPITISCKAGDQISTSDMAAMYAFYAATCAKFGQWGSHYLPEDFFLRLAKNFRHRCLLIIAHREGEAEPAAMAIFIYKGNRMFGRYWGSKDEFDLLHFEMCYYQPIEWCISQGILTFDAGAGNGPHKIRRGFKTVDNYSWHRFFDETFHENVAHYLED